LNSSSRRWTAASRRWFGLRKTFLLLAAVFLLSRSFPAGAEQQESASCSLIKAECPDAEIREIRISHEEVFTAGDDLPRLFPWRTLNRLHADTGEDVIRRQFLFSEGDRLDPDLIRETLRNLRTLDYFRDERIECSLLEPGKVRVDVSLRENWSLIPIFSVQGVDTAVAVTAGVTEQNLLGRGKNLSLWYRKGAEKGNTIIEDAGGLRYVDPNILGSWYQTAWTLQKQETGEFLQAVAEHPFYSLETPWSFLVFGEHFRRKSRLIRNGRIAADYEQQDDAGGIDFQVALTRCPPVVHRLGPTYQFTQRRIREFRILSADMRDLERPADDTTSSLGIAYQRLGVDFVIEERISRFDRREDFNLANDLDLRVAYSAEALGADEDEWLFSLSDVQGHAFRKGHFLFLEVSGEGALGGGRLRNGVFSVGYDHYLQDTFLDGGPFLHTLHWLGSFSYGTDLDVDRLLGLGYPNGLRGYERDAFTGDKRLLVSLEDRIFLARDLFGLVALGLLAFFDGGYVWDVGQAVDLADLRYDTGLGLRIALPAVAGPNILKLTWGFPLGSGADPLGDYVFTVATSADFG
jgi:outer membrane protein assembly factor BamA